MSIGEFSRHNYCTVISVVDDSGARTENDRIDFPFHRDVIVNTSQPSTREYIVRAGDNWSNIAARFFKGRSDLWWIIAEFSNIIDPFNELVVGAKLKIPQFDTVMFEVLNFNTSKRGRPSDNGAE